MTGAPDVLANVRDLGGLPLTGGGTTSRSVLIRSDAPYAGDRAPSGVTWPPATVVDLRDKKEGSAAAQWPDDVRVVSNPLFSGARLDRVVNTPLVEVYRGMLDTASARIVAAVNAFDESGSTLVHCAAGKDRTGVVIAVSLLLAGVQRDAIVRDYRRTEDSIRGVYARMNARGRVPSGVTLDHQILGTPDVAVELVLDRIDRAAGGRWGWFETNGGDVATFQQWTRRFRGDHGVRRL